MPFSLRQKHRQTNQPSVFYGDAIKKPVPKSVKKRVLES